MKNTFVTIALFLGMLGFIFYSHNMLIDVCNHIDKHCTDIEMALDKKDNEKAYKYTMEIKDLLEEKSTPIAIYVNHTDINSLNSEVIKLSQYIKKDDMKESYATVHAVKYACKYIRELETISIKNIF